MKKIIIQDVYYDFLKQTDKIKGYGVKWNNKLTEVISYKTNKQVL